MKRELRLDMVGAVIPYLAAAVTASTIQSDYFDTINYNSGIVTVLFGATQTAADVTLTHSDTFDGVYADVPTTLFTLPDLTDGGQADIHIFSLKRFVKVKVVVDTTSDVAISLVLGDRDYMASAAEVKN